MIIVTGANGQLGRAVVERLLARVPAERIGVSVREPARAKDLAERGVRVRQADFTDAASLAHAFDGAAKVLVVSTDAAGEACVAQHRTAVEAAAKAGADRIYYTSHLGVSPSSLFLPMRDHAATEVALRDSGVPFTSLRNGFYAATVPMLLGQALHTGELAAPADGPVSWTTHADLAAATALALTEDGFDGPTPPLTGPEAVDLAGVADIVTRLTGREIRRVVVADADYRAGLLANGLPEWRADLLLGMFAASRRGEFATVDPALATLLGRPAAGLASFLKAVL
ncbi:NAD(P)H-binding protein [Actinophytocola sp.]|uniref:NAD(P)H-binding protein n=1 Tax=Actinophytocola sp. TaxID=1872138 RepID=UPI00389B1D25